MATWYVDFNNGLDTNNGTSFAQRVKTLTKAASLAAAGDTVRVMGKPPTNSGTATWTNRFVIGDALGVADPNFSMRMAPGQPPQTSPVG